MLVFVAIDTDWTTVDDGRVPARRPRRLGEALLEPYVLPFEIASVLLVVAMIGAIMLVASPEDEAEDALA